MINFVQRKESQSLDMNSSFFIFYVCIPIPLWRRTNSGTKLCSNLKLNILVKLKLENDYSKLVLVPALEADSTQNCAVMNAWLGLINQLFFWDLISSNIIWQTPMECLTWHCSYLAAQCGTAFWNHPIHLLKALGRSLTRQTKVRHNNICI